MKRILWFFILFIFSLGIFQYALAQPNELTLLKKINVATSVDNTTIELRFNGLPFQEKIDYREDFVQIEFPDSFISPAKQWHKVGDDIVKNIFAYQFNDTTVRVRLFTYGKSENLRDKIRFSRDNNKVIILYNQETGTLDKETRVSIRDTKGGEDNKVQLPAVPETVGTQQETNSPSFLKGGEGGLSNNSPDITASIFKMVLALGIVLSLLFAAVFLFKKFFGGKIGLAGKGQQIRVITSTYLGPRKSIAVVDVAGERIVVGVTPTHITMLTRLRNDDEFKDILNERMTSPNNKPNNELNNEVELNDDLWEKV